MSSRNAINRSDGLNLAWMASNAPCCPKENNAGMSVSLLAPPRPAKSHAPLLLHLPTNTVKGNHKIDSRIGAVRHPSMLRKPRNMATRDMCRLVTVSSKLDEIVTFHQKNFHQKPLSSKTTFIPKTTFIKIHSLKNHFHQNPLSSKPTFVLSQLVSAVSTNDLRRRIDNVLATFAWSQLWINNSVHDPLEKSKNLSNNRCFGMRPPR